MGKLRDIVDHTLIRAVRAAERRDIVAAALWRDLVIDYATPSVRFDERSEFIALCRAFQHTGRAQLHQDLWVLFETKSQRGGYFVEFGAVDGLAHSNTVLLERDFGWNGILAEPNPTMSSRIATSRTAIVDTRCVWTASGEHVELLVTPDPEFSTLVGLSRPDQHSGTERASGSVQKVETVSLSDLLDEHCAPAVIDYLSVDTEGTEYDILSAFSFESRTVRLLSIEHNNRPIEREIDKLMFSHGYERRFAELSGWDAWYRLIT